MSTNNRYKLNDYRKVPMQNLKGLSNAEFDADFKSVIKSFIEDLQEKIRLKIQYFAVFVHPYLFDHKFSHVAPVKLFKISLNSS